MTRSSEKIVSNNQALVDALVKFQRWCEAGGPELVAELASLKAQLAEAEKKVEKLDEGLRQLIATNQNRYCQVSGDWFASEIEKLLGLRQ